MTPFEKWFAESGHRDSIKPALMQAWLACAAEAERLCRRQLEMTSNTSLAPLVLVNLAAAIAKLAEVDRG